MTQQTDQIRRFIFEGSNVRGVHVRLGDAWQSIRERNQHAWPVNTLLGEALAASTLLASTIKIDGSLTIQTSGSGPVKMLVVQATGARTVRGMVSVRGEISSDSFEELLGEGHLAITIDPGTGGERYQGIVSYDGGPLAPALELYFARSEQLGTRVSGDTTSTFFSNGLRNETDGWARRPTAATAPTPRMVIHTYLFHA